MSERKWVVKDVLQGHTNYVKIKTALNNLNSCTAIDTEEYFFMCQNSALSLMREKISQTDLYTRLKRASEDGILSTSVVAALKKNEKAAVVFIDKKANMLYSRSDNIIAINEDFKSCTFFNNKYVNDNLLEKNYNKSEDCEINAKRIEKLLEIGSIDYPVRSVNLEKANEIAIFSNYYQFLLNYNFFNIQEFDKEYNKATVSNDFASCMHAYIYKQNVNTRFAFLLKKTRKWF